MGSNDFQNYFHGVQRALTALIGLNDFCHVFVTIAFKASFLFNLLCWMLGQNISACACRFLYRAK
jgi:hypothetical protein